MSHEGGGERVRYRGVRRALQTVRTACAKGQKNELAGLSVAILQWQGWGWGRGGRKAGPTPHRAVAKLKSLNTILEAVKSLGGIFSGFAIQKSLAGQQDRV